MFPFLTNLSKIPHILTYRDCYGMISANGVSLSGKQPQKEQTILGLASEPNFIIDIKNVSLNNDLISFIDTTSKINQLLYMRINIDNVYPLNSNNRGIGYEFTFGGNVNISNSKIEGIDYYSGSYTNKLLRTNINNCIISHTGYYNQRIINGEVENITHTSITNSVLNTLSQNGQSEFTTAYTNNNIYYYNGDESTQSNDFFVKNITNNSLSTDRYFIENNTYSLTYSLNLQDYRVDFNIPNINGKIKVILFDDYFVDIERPSNNELTFIPSSEDIILNSVRCK